METTDDFYVDKNYINPPPPQFSGLIFSAQYIFMVHPALLTYYFLFNLLLPFPPSPPHSNCPFFLQMQKSCPFYDFSFFLISFFASIPLPQIQYLLFCIHYWTNKLDVNSSLPLPFLWGQKLIPIFKFSLFQGAGKLCLEFVKQVTKIHWTFIYTIAGTIYLLDKSATYNISI